MYSRSYKITEFPGFPAKIRKSVTIHQFIGTFILSCRNNFAKRKFVMINKQINIAEAVFEDEVVCFLAERYHTSARQIVKEYLIQDGLLPITDESDMIFRLEDNEMEILRDLSRNCQR